MNKFVKYINDILELRSNSWVTLLKRKGWQIDLYKMPGHFYLYPTILYYPYLKAWAVGLGSYTIQYRPKEKPFKNHLVDIVNSSKNSM